MSSPHQTFNLAQGTKFILCVTLQIGIKGEYPFLHGSFFLLLLLGRGRLFPRPIGGGIGAGGATAAILSVEEPFAAAGFVAGCYGAVFYLLSAYIRCEQTYDGVYKCCENETSETYMTLDIQSHAKLRSMSQSLYRGVDVTRVPKIGQTIGHLSRWRWQS